MSKSFVSRRNELTGENEWVLVPEDYDYLQEIGRAAYTDMLQDTDRNEKYDEGLRRTIGRVKGSGREAVVLDIGTGTGLLSMMALRAGADRVYACEGFEPMSEVAERITKANGYGEIKIISKRSTEIKVPRDLPEKCNILVTEVFDTELIGEGAIQTYNHAIEFLLTEGFEAVPSSASVYVQLANSELIRKFNTLPLDLSGPADTHNCPGVNSVHDLQLSNLTEFDPLTLPIKVFHFDFRKKLEYPRSKEIELEPEKLANTGFLYWRLKMDLESELEISCFPSYHGNEKWRDHWMQAAYYIPPPQNQNEKNTLKIVHDEYSYYLSYEENEKNCKCLVHPHVSRHRMLALNEFNYNSMANCVLQSGFKNVLVHSDNTLIHCYLKKLNKFDGIYVKGFQFGKEVNESCNYDCVTIGDPYFISSVTPLDNLKFFFENKHKITIPSVAIVSCLFVQFDKLHLIRRPVGEVCGFDLSIFDELVLPAMEKVDSAIEPHPVWEYDFKSTSQKINLLKITTKNQPKTTKTKTNLKPGTNGVIFYVDYFHEDLAFESNKRQIEAVQFIEINEGEFEFCFDLQTGITRT